MATDLGDPRGGHLTERTHASGIARNMLMSGTTVPTDAASGYTTGCVFVHIDGGSATAIYVNVGTSVSANFDPMASIPTNYSSLGADNTLMVFPSDSTDVTGFNVAGRIAVKLPSSDGTGSTLRWIPVYFGD